MNTRDNDVEVEFEVRVPAGVRFVGRTVNGGVEAADLPDDAEAYTVNGERARSARPARQGGDRERLDPRRHGPRRRARAAVLQDRQRRHHVELPGSAEADVHAETVNGGIETDFPLTVTGQVGGPPHRRHDRRAAAAGWSSRP